MKNEISTNSSQSQGVKSDDTQIYNNLENKNLKVINLKVIFNLSQGLPNPMPGSPGLPSFHSGLSEVVYFCLYS